MQTITATELTNGSEFVVHSLAADAYGVRDLYLTVDHIVPVTRGYAIEVHDRVGNDYSIHMTLDTPVVIYGA